MSYGKTSGGEAAILVLFIFIFGVALGILTSLLSGLFLMFLLGIIHNDVSGVPALGFWASWATMMIATIVGQAFRTNVEVKK